MSPFRLVKSVRSLQRLRRIVTVLTQHGFGHVIDRMNLRRYAGLRRWRRGAGADEVAAMSVGQRLAAVCSDLGPTFIKLAQMATTRPDLLPAEVLADLSSLQDHVPPFDAATARQTIESDLARPLDQLFSSFSDTPLASGSIGQVHSATTTDGTPVVVKVKRPDIDEIVRLDLFLLKLLAEAMETFLPELRIYRPVVFVDEFELATLRELDFTQEASNTTRFHAAFAEDPHLRIPATRWELSSARVLVLEVIRGRNIEKCLLAGQPPVDRRLLALRLANLYLKQFFEVGTFHADPHPGNILVSPPAEIGLIDFGQVGVVSDELAAQMIAVLAAAIYREPELIVSVLDNLDAVGPNTDTRTLTRDLRVLQDKYYGLPLKRLDLVAIFHEATAVMRKHDVAMPRELVLVLKTLTTVMGLVLRLDPEMDLVALFRPRLKQLIRDRMSADRLVRSAGLSGWHVLSLLREAPRQLRSALRLLSRGQWQLNVRHERIDRLISELDRSTNRLSFSIVIAAIIVGSSVVMTSEPHMSVLGIPLQWFGVFGYLFAGLLGIALLLAIFRSGRFS